VIARLRVVLPYFFAVGPDPLPEFSFRDSEYLITVASPFRSDITADDELLDSTVTIDQMEERLRPRITTPWPPSFLVDDTPWELCNVVQIDFFRERPFDRHRGSDPAALDPPIEYCFDILNSVLARLRIRTMSSFVRPIEPDDVIRRMAYLDESGAEFSSDPEGQKIRAVGFRRTKGQVVTLSSKVWESLKDLPHDFRPALWDIVLLDAFGLLENVGLRTDIIGMRADLGAALVLAHTAVEMRIDDALPRLVPSSPLSDELWDWISVRGRDLDRQPTVEEKLDILLKTLGGSSLKTNARLWQDYQRLRKSRNAFVHRGHLEYDNEPLTREKADRLLRTAVEVLDFIEHQLPEYQRRPQRVDSGTKTIALQQRLTGEPPLAPASDEGSDAGHIPR
jgi:hypothetical protein